MFYIAVEKQATQQVPIANSNQKRTIHALLTNELHNGENVVPVFLSRLHAHLYLTPKRLFHEFKLVTLNSLELATYRDVCEEERKTGKECIPDKCHIVLSVSQQKDESVLGFYTKPYKLNEILLDAELIEQELKNKLGDIFSEAEKSDQGSDIEIMQKGDALIQKMGLRMVELNIAPENNDNTPIGSTYGFALLDQSDNFCILPQQKEPTVLTFINKLDAMIYLQMLNEKEKTAYEPVALNNPRCLVLLKIGKKLSNMQVAVAYGFTAVIRPFGNQWAKVDKNDSIASLQYSICDFSDVENGFKLDQYFGYLTQELERTQAVGALIQTNLSSVEQLQLTAKRVMEDMKTNAVLVDPNDEGIYHRLVFSGE